MILQHKILSALALALNLILFMFAKAQEGLGPVEVSSIAFSPDGSQLAVGSGHDICLEEDFEPFAIQIIDVETNQVVQNLVRHQCAVSKVSWSPDSTRLASSGSDGLAFIWDVVSGEVLAIAENSAVGLSRRGITWNSSSDLVADFIVTSPRTDIWDAETGVILTSIEDSNHVRPSAIAWSPDGYTLAIVNRNFQLQFWDVSDVINTEDATLIGIYANIPAISLAWSPDGDSIAYGTAAGTIVVLDPFNGNTLQTLTGHTGPVLDIDWSPDGTNLITGSLDNTVRIWDVVSGAESSQIQTPNRVRAVAWSSDGSKVAYSGEGDDTVEIAPAPGIETPTPTPIPTDTPTDTPTATFTPTDTPTPTATHTPTDTPTPTPTNTPSGFDCPCNVFGDSTPATPAWSADSDGVELGMRFRASVAGQVTGVRFYKGTGNSGTHVGHLWTNAGTLLGSVTFTNETSSGWQEAIFSTPISISADTTYVVSYHAPNGNYAVDRLFFDSPLDNPPLKALASGEDGTNGVYSYGASGTFPTSVFQTTNYWIDVIFVPGVPTPTPTPTPNCPCNIFGSSVPANPSWNDSSAVELGLRFRASEAGEVTGVRFYKGSGNTGTHVGHLWTNAGTLLGSVTFTNETSSGWQEATFSTPIAISAETTYVVSYHAPNGHYSVDRPALVSAVNNPPLKALADDEDGANGVYAYGSSGTFPTNAPTTSTNYWVDVIFVPDEP